MTTGTAGPSTIRRCAGHGRFAIVVAIVVTLLSCCCCPPRTRQNSPQTRPSPA